MITSSSPVDAHAVRDRRGQTCGERTRTPPSLVNRHRCPLSGITPTRISPVNRFNHQINPCGTIFPGVEVRGQALGAVFWRILGVELMRGLAW